MEYVLALTDNDIHVLWHVILPLIGSVAGFAFLVWFTNGALEDKANEDHAVKRIEGSLRWKIEEAQRQACRRVLARSDASATIGALRSTRARKPREHK